MAVDQLTANIYASVIFSMPLQIRYCVYIPISYYVFQTAPTRLLQPPASDTMLPQVSAWLTHSTACWAALSVLMSVCKLQINCCCCWRRAATGSVFMAGLVAWRAFAARLSVFKVSWRLVYAGLTHAIMTALASPPRLFCSRRVSRLFLHISQGSNTHVFQAHWQ